MIQSIIYRFVLISLSFCICYNMRGAFNGWYVLFISIAYFAVYMLLKKYKRDKSRLLVDFIYINAIIWGREISNPVAFLLALMPIINAINFSGERKNDLLLILFVSLTFIFHHDSLGIWVVIPIFSLYTVFLFSWLSKRKWEMMRNVTDHVDNYFLNKNNLKPHDIYKYIIEDLNNYFHLNGSIGFKRISAYTRRDNILWLVNSSNFIWNRTLEFPDDTLEKISSNRYVKLSKDDKTIYIVTTKPEDVEYYFICEVSNNMVLLGVKDVLEKVFFRVSLFLNVEYRKTLAREKNFDDIKNNILYVKTAVRIMHHIRNKLSPVKNLARCCLDIEKFSDEQKALTKNIIKQEARQAENDLTDILATADYLLEKNNNPFVESEKKEVKYGKIYIVVSEIVERKFSGIVHTNSEMQSRMDDNIVSFTNIKESKIMITDWVENMHKYYRKYYWIEMSLTNEKLIIHFENDIHSTNDIDSLIRDINSTSKDAVIEGKKGNGINIMKSIAKDLDIKLSAYKKRSEKNVDLLCLDIIYKVYEQKNSNN